ncbi:carbohydrate ABC transporter permease [Streptomyces daghestanicus]|uniref:Sugar ABC transporter permease n=1 Tax=Streptomyces daghestanicus TaxID=66885 RepID=A0ABQ3PXP1_9ACTN|nr:sugar ABC transporter permease [Streptomyces daghestanicus]GGU24743.1 sugar ABC transporter permease [Streptomyces daghestanicus]GHI29779.1 sugar ABC transporter permease [Streptomyces daghestanicus]
MTIPAPPLVRRPAPLARRRAAAAYIVPFFVLFTLVMVVPIGYAVWTSLFREESSGLGFGGTETVFAGLGNYADALADPALRAAFLHIVGYVVLYVPLMTCAALLLALLLDSAAARAKRLFQLALFLPYTVPTVIAAIIWAYLYSPSLSPVMDWFDALGVTVDFFSAPMAVPSVVNIVTWHYVGYNMVILYAALQAIPRETLEAATMDGAGAIRTALSIKVPHIRSALVLSLLFTCVGAIQLFNEPYMLTVQSEGVNRDWSPVMFVHKAAFVDHRPGLAAAAALLITLLAGALSFAVTKLGNRWKAA